MFDSKLQPRLQPLLTVIAHGADRLGLSANHLTGVGFLIGLAAAGSILLQEYQVALALFLLNRFLDGLDGALARLQGPSAFGGFLDVVADFLIYQMIPCAFGIANPDHRLAALVLMLSFVGTGITFLGFASVHAQLGRHAPKALAYIGGLTEGTETIFVFVLMLLWPEWFPGLAYVFATLCGLATIERVFFARRAFAEPGDR
ncbi:MAG: CDP-alcohol phosphatidyltransferase family protein [Gemmataceae bacterium]